MNLEIICLTVNVLLCFMKDSWPFQCYISCSDENEIWNIDVKTGLIAVIMTKRMLMQTNQTGPNCEEARHSTSVYFCLGASKQFPPPPALGALHPANSQISIPFRLLLCFVFENKSGALRLRCFGDAFQDTSKKPWQSFTLCPVIPRDNYTGRWSSLCWFIAFYLYLITALLKRCNTQPVMPLAHTCIILVLFSWLRDY